MATARNRFRFFAAIAPEDRAGDPTLPLTLLVRPGPLLALFVLGLNDHVLKGSGWLPGWLTGKLSDFAGLVYFPLLLVTAVNLVGFLAGKRRVRFASASYRQLVIACIATGVFFAAVQLHDGTAWFYARASALLMFWNGAQMVQVTMDPTDIVAVLALPFAYILGRRAIQQIPPGRLAFARAHVGHIAASAVLIDIRKHCPARAHGALDAVCAAIDDEAAPGVIDARLDAYRAQISR